MHNGLEVVEWIWSLKVRLSLKWETRETLGREEGTLAMLEISKEVPALKLLACIHHFVSFPWISSSFLIAVARKQFSFKAITEVPCGTLSIVANDNRGSCTFRWYYLPFYYSIRIFRFASVACGGRSGGEGMREQRHWIKIRGCGTSARAMLLAVFLGDDLELDNEVT